MELADKYGRLECSDEGNMWEAGLNEASQGEAGKAHWWNKNKESPVVKLVGVVAERAPSFPNGPADIYKTNCV